MLKKISIITLICTLGISSLFANVDYQFDLFSIDPLHKEYFADTARADMSVTYQHYFEGIPNVILQDIKVNAVDHTHEVQVWNLKKDLYSSVMEVKLGETVSIARNTITFDNFLSPISFDLSAQALMQAFYTEEFNNGIGYDGIYFYGGTLRIGDVLSMRIGQHHYCSHYGDQVFKLIDKDTNVNPDFDTFNFGYKYIRMNTHVIGLSIEPSSMFRIYGELNYPSSDLGTLRPNMFAPNWVMSGNSALNGDYPDSYNARIVNVGVEVTYPIFKQLGDTKIGYDLHMYEEGKVSYDHENGGDVSFDEDAPWELEHNIRIAQQISDTTYFEIDYHNGRSPFNNFYFLHTSYISLGLRYKPNATITIFDTK